MTGAGPAVDDSEAFPSGGDAIEDGGEKAPEPVIPEVRLFGLGRQLEPFGHQLVRRAAAGCDGSEARIPPP